MSTPIIELPEWAPFLCSDWHGGQGSAMYAVASTGALSRGTIRPIWWDNVRCTDEQWDYVLVGRLRDECDIVVAGLSEPYALIGPDYSNGRAVHERARMLTLRDVCDRWLEDHADVVEEGTP